MWGGRKSPVQLSVQAAGRQQFFKSSCHLFPFSGVTFRLMPPDYVCPLVDLVETQILIGFVFLIPRLDVLAENWLRGWPSSSAFPEFPRRERAMSQLI